MSGTTTGTGGLTGTGNLTSDMSTMAQGTLDSNTIAQLVRQLLGAQTGTSGAGGTSIATPQVAGYQVPNTQVANPLQSQQTAAYSTLLQQILALMRAGGQSGSAGAGGGAGTGTPSVGGTNGGGGASS